MKDVFRMSDKAYDTLKWLCLIFIPLLSAAYAGLSEIWGFPFSTQIPATLSILQTFLGGLLGVSTIVYQRGSNSLTDITGGGGDG